MINSMRTIKARWSDREFGDGVGVKVGAVGGERRFTVGPFSVSCTEKLVA